MVIVLILVLVAVAITFVAAFFYVSRIISLPPKGRAVDNLNNKLEKNQRIIACIGDSLTHGNIGVSWVDKLRKEFPLDIFLNEGINSDTGVSSEKRPFSTSFIKMTEVISFVIE